jgi:hypothetical protein
VLCTALIWSLGVALPARQAQAAPLATEALAQIARDGAARERVLALFEREEVARGLESYGIDPAEARARIAALSDAEIARIAGRLDALPAGGDTFGAIALGILIAFALLVITDMLGWTDVFPQVGPVH